MAYHQKLLVAYNRVMAVRLGESLQYLREDIVAILQKQVFPQIPNPIVQYIVLTPAHYQTQDILGKIHPLDSKMYRIGTV